MVQWEGLGFVRSGFLICEIGVFKTHFLWTPMVSLSSVGSRGFVTDCQPYFIPL